MFGDASISIPCGNCGHKTTKEISWLKTHRSFICRCGTQILLDRKDFLSGIKSADKALADFKRRIRKIGKR